MRRCFAWSERSIPTPRSLLPRGVPRCWISSPRRCSARRKTVNARNKFLIVLGIILAASTAYYLISTPRSSDLVLIGTVDSNQIIVSPQMQGRIAKLLVVEGTQVTQGDVIGITHHCG